MELKKQKGRFSISKGISQVTTKFFATQLISRLKLGPRAGVQFFQLLPIFLPYGTSINYQKLPTSVSLLNLPPPTTQKLCKRWILERLGKTTSFLNTTTYLLLSSHPLNIIIDNAHPGMYFAVNSPVNTSYVM